MSELAGAMALGQMRKVKMITGKMRDAKWRIREAIKGIPGLGLPATSPTISAGDTRADADPPSIRRRQPAGKRFVLAAFARAEGIRGPEGSSLANISMREWGMHAGTSTSRAW